MPISYLFERFIFLNLFILNSKSYLFLYFCLFSVATLKEAVQRTCGITLDKQVLLASGGETLDPSVRVCSYSAGTDTSPIFLFSKSAIESATPPIPSVDCGSGNLKRNYSFIWVFFELRSLSTNQYNRFRFKR